MSSTELVDLILGELGLPSGKSTGTPFQVSDFCAVTRRDADLAAARRELGRAAVLSVSQACLMLPLAADRGARWLRAEGLVRTLDGKEVVVWGEVLDRITGGAKGSATWAPKQTALPRVKL